MLAPVLSAATRLIAYAARPVIALRYRIDVRGLSAIRQRGRSGILFLPNHSALLDPAFIVARLFPSFQVRALADEHQVNRTVFGRVALLYGSRILPNLERSGAEARDRTRAALNEIAAALKAGENILLYPSGRLKRQYLEDIGSASGVETLVKAVPDVRIVLVRYNGLWGSSFSIAFNGQMPDLGAALARGARRLLLNGIFFMPRRRVTMEFVEPDDFPRTGTRAEMNQYLERFYNANASRNTYVPYGFWEKGGTRELPDPPQTIRDADASEVSPATRDLVLAHLRIASGRDDVTLTHHLARDLGLDSLTTAELVAWLQAEFGFSVDTPESLQTVADVVLAAAGQGVSARASDLKTAPPAWFAAADNHAVLTVAPGTTLTRVFLAQAAARPSQPIFADQASGVRCYRDLVTAVLVLKPILEKLPGSCVGVMMPASVGAAVFLLAAWFAGKTAVMVNWTIGTRALRHSLDVLGVTTVITARALVTKLASSGTDMADVQDRFLFVEDVLSGVRPLDKIRAAVRSRLSWAPLERAKAAEVAVVLFTSGSESLPKAVPLTHLNLLTNVRDILHMGRLVESDVIVGLLPPFHSFGLTTTVVLPLCIGARTVFHPNPTESALLAKVIAAYRASVLFGTPTFLSGIARVASDEQLASLRLAVTGAEKCPAALFSALGARWPSLVVLEGYGITECSPVVAVNPMDAPVPGTIGRLLPTVEGVVLDLDLARRVAPGDTGMLLVRGPSVFGGYLNYSGESPFVSFEGKSWYRTGDLVSATADGILSFRGRLKRFIKIGGEMVSLPAIEAVLQQYFGDSEEGPVIAVEAIGTPEHPDVVLFTTSPADRADVNGLIKGAGLSPLHYVRQVTLVDAIPVLGTGKTDYRALKARYGDAGGQA
jgi:acyl-CoA synthetase (AMP-forming)/AMP-acid ligase II/1-acyl-sn-glycerol-3-phosphate acyltransferase/acyl carrier protein